MSHQLHSSLVRILTADGMPVGVGFVASENLILTCAHVIAQASGSDATAHFDLPLLAPGESFSGRVLFRDDEQDIATIEATGLPVDATPVRLVQTDELWGDTFRAFGVPRGHDSGVWASGALRDQNNQGWMQIEDVKTEGVSVKPGFSGGPVWDENAGGVVGMVVAADRDESTKVAFCIPVEKLSEVVPALKTSLVKAENKPNKKATGGKASAIFIGGNVERSNIISGDNNIITQQVQNIFSKTDEVDTQAELRETLTKLTSAVEEMNKKLPREQALEATDDLERLVTEATKPKPSKKWYSVSIEGLIQAAEKLGDAGEPVISLSKKVLFLLANGLAK